MEKSYTTLSYIIFFIFFANQRILSFGSEESFEALKIQSHLVYSSKSCGRIYSSPVAAQKNNEKLFLAISGKQILKTRFGKVLSNKEISWRTPEGQIFINIEESSFWDNKERKKWLMQQLLSQINIRAKSKFREELEPFKKLNIKGFGETYLKMERELFPEYTDTPQNYLKIIFSIYPELVDSIKNNRNDELRALFCYYQRDEHNIKIAYRWSNLFLIPTAALGISAFAVATAGIAVPVGLSIAAILCSTLIGARDVAMSAHRLWPTEKSAKIAAKMKHFYTKTDKLYETLLKKQKKTDELTEGEYKLLVLLKNLKKDQKKGRLKDIKKIVNSRHFNRILMAFGILSTTVHITFNSFDFIKLLHMTGLFVDLPKQTTKVCL